jgi:hypothetical protein
MVWLWCLGLVYASEMAESGPAFTRTLRWHDALYFVVVTICTGMGPGTQPGRRRHQRAICCVWDMYRDVSGLRARCLVDFGAQGKGNRLMTRSSSGLAVLR